ncbi:MAG: TIGR01620 family protein [Amylibacter sp.]|nr:TIGR01620 family protein [Amylibacter sp.]
MKKPVVIDLSAPKTKTKAQKQPTPADVPAVPETVVMQAVTHVAAQNPSRLGRFFIWLVVTLIGFVASIAFWDFVTGMMARNLWLGRVALGLTGLIILCLLIFALRELAAFARLRKMDGLRELADLAHSQRDLKKAQDYSVRLERLYAGRQDLRWGFTKLAEQDGDVLDADAHLALLETTVVAVLDKQAAYEVEAAARQVATVTAIIPLALADVAVALTSNMRMIRRIAQIYGGRSGLFGSWRLFRAVAAHLVATGAVAIGDDLIGSIVGGGVLSKLSRRFGEGIINGALTARVGVAAMEVCRPMQFRARQKPSVTGMMKRALTGFIGKT